MTLAVTDEIIGEEDGNKHDGNLELVQAQIHLIIVDAPADDNKKREEEKSDLHTGADGNTNGKIHLVLHGDGDGSGVFGGVSNNGEQNKTDKLLSQ